VEDDVKNAVAFSLVAGLLLTWLLGLETGLLDRESDVRVWVVLFAGCAALAWAWVRGGERFVDWLDWWAGRG